jgi:hypothetical protein
MWLLPHLPLEKLQSLPRSCPVCSADWVSINLGTRTTSDSPFANFAFALRRLREVVAQGGSLPFRVLLEFDEPG